MPQNFDIVPCDWKYYLLFRSLCCVPTIPFGAGPCWRTRYNSGFIGYNYVFRDNAQRYRVLPFLKSFTPKAKLLWMNQNLLCLNRLMVDIPYRGRGIAHALVEYTLPLLPVRFCECITYQEKVCSILAHCGFHVFGWSRENQQYYYLFENSTIPEKKQGIPT